MYSFFVLVCGAMSNYTKSYQVITKSGYTVVIPLYSGNKKARQPIDNTVKGVLSQKSKSKMESVLIGWNECIRNAPRENKKKWTIQPRFTLLTLTLSSKQIHTDEEIKTKLLNPFLTDLKSVLGKNLLYLWSAESQPNITQHIHFHIVLDRFVCKDWAQSVWNRMQDRLGYIERCEFSNPPSTHIKTHPVNEKTVGYLMKYLSKGAQGTRKISGKLWGCSHILLKLNVCVKGVYSESDVDCLLYEAEKAGCETYKPCECVIYFAHNISQRTAIFSDNYDMMLLESAESEYAKISKIVDSYRFVRF